MSFLFEAPYDAIALSLLTCVVLNELMMIVLPRSVKNPGRLLIGALRRA